MPEPFNPQAFNRYSYVVNNPLKYTDPTGHKMTIIPDSQLDDYNRNGYDPAPHNNNLIHNTGNPMGTPGTHWSANDHEGNGQSSSGSTNHQTASTLQGQDPNFLHLTSSTDTRVDPLHNKGTAGGGAVSLGVDLLRWLLLNKRIDNVGQAFEALSAQIPLGVEATGTVRVLEGTGYVHDSYFGTERPWQDPTKKFIYIERSIVGTNPDLPGARDPSVLRPLPQ